MGTSDITVAGLATTPGIGYIELAWTYSDPRNGALPNIALDQVEVWAAASNNLAAATKVGEGVTSARHSGIANGSTWYYWIRARNRAGSLGAFYPTSPSGGISATEATAAQVTLSALTAVASVGQVVLQWVVTDPSSTGLGYLGFGAAEVWAAGSNDRAGATKVTEGLTAAVHNGVPEESTRYYWIKPRNRNGTYGAFFPASSTAGVQSKALGVAGLTFGMANGNLVFDTHATDAAVPTNAGRISIKTASGNDPSPGDPVFLAFRSATLSVGSYSILSITAALSFVISAGSSIGGRLGKAFKLWVVVFNDNGTLRIGIKNCSNGFTVIFPLKESGLESAIAEGGAGGADSSGVMYASQAITSQPYRILGYLEWSGGFPSVEGNWTVGPDVNRLYSAGVQTPGGVVWDYPQIIDGPYTTTSVIPLDSSIPQSGEGLNFASAAVTPQSACNFIELDITLTVSHSVASAVIAAVFRDSDADATICGCTYIAAGNAIGQLRITYRMTVGDVTARTYMLRVGAALAGTLTINGQAGGDILSKRLISMFRVAELAG